MIYVFSDYEIDLDCYELRLRKTPLHIEPKVFKLLAYLVQHHDRFVSKTDLYQHLWPNQATSEAALTYCIKAARKAIGDNGHVQRIIKTVYGRGYRFVASVEQQLHQDVHPNPRPVSIPVRHERSFLAVSKMISADESCGLEDGGLAAERRQLTVVWCRMIPAPMGDGDLDLEDLHEVMQDIHRLCARVVGRFGGHLAHYFGDGFLIYFGYPGVPQPQQSACRAIRAGLEMVRETGRFHEGFDPKIGVKLAMRVGIHTGMVVMHKDKNGEKRGRLLLGNTPHVAMRLQDLAQPNTVVLSPTTLSLVEGYFVYQSLGAHILDDVSPPLMVYVIVSERGARAVVP